mmetsp:Transcript_44918/g.137170  ORF Transcript_44918/g.137170 Transcript_44918/m.137170 type:complete len:88 (-) Transcript_44918:478-741(-)
MFVKFKYEHTNSKASPNRRIVPLIDPGRRRRSDGRSRPPDEQTNAGHWLRNDVMAARPREGAESERRDSYRKLQEGQGGVGKEPRDR